MEDKLPSKHTELMKIIICNVCLKLWKTRCFMIITQNVINSNALIKQILADLRRRSLDKYHYLPWNILDL